MPKMRIVSLQPTPNMSQLATMPQLAFEELVQLCPKMCLQPPPQNESKLQVGPQNVELCSIEKEFDANTVDRAFKVRTKLSYAYR